MSAAPASPEMPRVPLMAMGLLAIVSVTIIAGARIAGVEPVQVRRTPVAVSADVRFADQADGAVRVTDAHDGHVIETFAPGTNAFVRTVMRGLVRVRKGAGIGEEAPFRLEKTVDAHLSLSDPATGRRIELDPFGNLNSEAFARLLSAEAKGRT